MPAPKVPKIEILEVRTEHDGAKLSMLVKFDTGEMFWYSCSGECSERDIENNLKSKYKRIQRAKSVKRQDRLIQLRKKLQNKRIDF